MAYSIMDAIQSLICGQYVSGQKVRVTSSQNSLAANLALGFHRLSAVGCGIYVLQGAATIGAPSATANGVYIPADGALTVYVGSSYRNVSAIASGTDTGYLDIAKREKVY